MKAIDSRPTRALNLGAILIDASNSGARVLKLVGVKRGKVKKGRQAYAKVGDWVKVSVRVGDEEMKGKVFDAVVVRQKRAWRRASGERISFSDNAAVILKDEKGNPKGTQIKGPICREIQERWKEVSKLASIVV